MSTHQENQTFYRSLALAILFQWFMPGLGQANEIRNSEPPEFTAAYDRLENAHGRYLEEVKNRGPKITEAQKESLRREIIQPAEKAYDEFRTESFNEAFLDTRKKMIEQFLGLPNTEYWTNALFGPSDKKDEKSKKAQKTAEKIDAPKVESRTSHRSPASLGGRKPKGRASRGGSTTKGQEVDIKDIPRVINY